MKKSKPDSGIEHPNITLYVTRPGRKGPTSVSLSPPRPRRKNPAAAALGRLGGAAGTGAAKRRSGRKMRAAIMKRWANEQAFEIECKNLQQEPTLLLWNRWRARRGLPEAKASKRFPAVPKSQNKTTK